MPYTPAALARRRCAHTYPEGHARAGERCRAFARWDAPGALDGSGLCTAHAGKVRGEDRPRGESYECRTVPKCACAAYPFPHRPGGGLCRWPDPPRASLQPRTAYGLRFRNPPRSAWHYREPATRTAPDVTPANTPPPGAVPPTVSGNSTPARAGDAWLAQLARTLGRRPPS